MGKKIGLILSGSGFYDGAEIQESVATLLAIAQQGAEVINFAPNVDQLEVIDHLEVKKEEGKRNVLVESARIVRGEIKDLKEFDASELDALIFPGGFGVAKNLCDFASTGADMKVNSEVEKAILSMAEQEKPMGFICIAPVLASKVLGAEVTVGENDFDSIDAVNKMSRHVLKKVTEIHVDEAKKVVSTPAFMCGPTIAEVFIGIEKLVKKVIEMS